MRPASLVGAAAILLAGCLAGNNPFEDRRDSVSHPEALLRASPFPELVVDIDYMAGAEPTQESLDLAFAALREVVDKSRITIEDPTPIPGGAEARGHSDLVEAATAGLDAPWPYTGADGVAHLHIVYMRGTYSNGTDDSIASGLYMPDLATAFVFPDTWRADVSIALALVGSGVPPSWLEAEVLTHEVGHAMGLVNYLIPAQSERIAPDDPCACHSARRASVMYPGIHNAQDHLQHILERQALAPIGYDDEDKADLAAYREGRTGPPVR